MIPSRPTPKVRVCPLCEPWVPCVSLQIPGDQPARTSDLFFGARAGPRDPCSHRFQTQSQTTSFDDGDLRAFSSVVSAAKSAVAFFLDLRVALLQFLDRAGRLPPLICTIQLYNLYRNTPLVTRSSCLSGPPTLNDIHQILTYNYTPSILCHRDKIR